MHYEFDKYAHKKSVIHVWDIRHKIISIFTLIIALTFTGQIYILAGVLAFSLLLNFSAKLPVKYIFQKLKFPTFFFLAIIIIMPFSGDKNVFFYIFNFPVYKNSAGHALVIILRGYSIILCGILIFATAPFDKTMRALRKIKVPEKITLIILYTQRYLNLYKNNLIKMKRAIKLRGGVKAYSKRSFLSYASLIVALIVRSFEQSDRVYHAMVLRGFSGKDYVNYKNQMVFKDYLKSFLFVVFSGIIIFYEVLL